MWKRFLNWMTPMFLRPTPPPHADIAFMREQGSASADDRADVLYHRVIGARECC